MNDLSATLPVGNRTDQNMRLRILAATHTAVTSFGIDNFSVTDVARITKTSRQTVYRYFSNKDELLMGLAQQTERIVEQGMEKLIGQGSDLKSRLYAISEYDDGGYSKALLQLESAHILRYFNSRRQYSRLKTIMEDALEPFLSEAESAAGIIIDRAMLVELIERLRVSLYVFTAGISPDWGARAIQAIVESVLANPLPWQVRDGEATPAQD
jgi:AcrR family transcriptional regulator